MERWTRLDTAAVSIKFDYFGLKYNSRSISHYGVASTSTAAYFIGGWDGDSPLDMIMEFKNNTWIWHGELLQYRAYHQTLTYDGETVIFGGQSIDGS